MKSTVGSSSKMPTDAGFSDSSESEHLVQHKFHLHISKQNKTWKMKKEDWKESPREENSASSNEERRAYQKRETALAPFHAQTRPWQLRVSVSSSPENVVTYYCWRWAWARDARPRPAKLYFTQLRFAYLPICHFFHIFENCQWFHNLCAWTHHLLSAHYWCHFTMLSFKPRINVWVFHHIYYLSIYKFIFCMRNSHFY